MYIYLVCMQVMFSTLSYITLHVRHKPLSIIILTVTKYMHDRVAPPPSPFTFLLLFSPQHMYYVLLFVFSPAIAMTPQHKQYYIFLIYRNFDIHPTMFHKL